MVAHIVGILALQGGFEKHAQVCRNMGYKVRLVKCRSDLNYISSIIVPGGESTVMLRLLERSGLREYLTDAIISGLPYFGTCAGMVLASCKADRLPFPSLSLMDIDVERNSYGRQKDSFKRNVSTPLLSDSVVEGVFIRAPRILRVGDNVEVLGLLDDEAVIVREKNVLAASFHPELTDDNSLHNYFFNEVVI
jgi:pyridoxal 5'-phosphate synthase pdxT subunit